MNSNELIEYVKELNKREAAEQALRREQAINKIRLLRQAQREQQERNRAMVTRG